MNPRIAAIVLAPALSLAACDTGLEGNIPLQEAQRAPPAELVAAVHARPDSATDAVIIDGRLWVPWGLPHHREPGELRAVGSSRGTTVYARAWDRPPYDALFVRDEDGAWQGQAPVLGRSP